MHCLVEQNYMCYERNKKLGTKLKVEEIDVRGENERVQIFYEEIFEENEQEGRLLIHSQIGEVELQFKLVGIEWRNE